jgi:hypothetical protein
LLCGAERVLTPSRTLAVLLYIIKLLLRFLDSPFAPRGLGRVSLAVLAVLRPLKRGRRLRRRALPVALKPL